jgi:hypothetical protein
MSNFEFDTAEIFRGENADEEEVPRKIFRGENADAEKVPRNRRTKKLGTCIFYQLKFRLFFYTLNIEKCIDYRRLNLDRRVSIDFEPKKYLLELCRRGLVVSSLPATKETGAMGREIESRQLLGKKSSLGTLDISEGFIAIK